MADTVEHGSVILDESGPVRAGAITDGNDFDRAAVGADVAKWRADDM